ncbi:MAG: C-GCAxxG-C-C family protein [Thermodesulfobacteriota bacterium]
MLKILGEDLNFNKEQAGKMATPFGGGVARWGTVCGAVVGGAMGIGFVFGCTKGEEKEKREKTYAKVQEMIKGFEKDHATIQCRELIQLNLLDPKDRKKFQELNMRRRCAQFVAKCAHLARQLIKEG